MSPSAPLNVESVVIRWKVSGDSERANCQLFLNELCELLGVEKTSPASDKVHKAEVEQAGTVRRVQQVQERPVAADDLARYFKPVPKDQQAARLQQKENLLQTLRGWGCCGGRREDVCEVINCLHVYHCW